MLQGVKQSGAFSGLHCMSANVFSLSQCRGTINTVSAHLFFAFFLISKSLIIFGSSAMRTHCSHSVIFLLSFSSKNNYRLHQ